MTLLNWEMTPDGLLILSDTLVLAGEERRPRNFMTKVYPVSHLNAVVAGTGIGSMVTSFFVHVASEMLVNDVVHVTEFAPTSLRSMWEQLSDQLLETATTTLYMFGIAAETGQFAGFAYRSTNDFAAEPLSYGMAFKPAPTNGEFPTIESLSDFAKYALVQQADDRALPRKQRIGIGGHLWMYSFEKDNDGALMTRVQRLIRLPHYGEDHELMLALLPENEGHPYSELILAQDP